MTLGLFLIALSLILKKPTAESKRNRTIFAAAIVVLCLGTAAFLAQMYMDYREYEGMRHVNLDYDVALKIDGEGRVRVLLPLPTAEAMYEGLGISPASSTYSINRSSGQARLDINMTENSTVHGSLYGLWSDIEAEMTWTTPANAHCDSTDCTSRVMVQIISGNLTQVHIILHAEWESVCHGHTWNMGIEAGPGDSEYPGDWLTMVC